MAKPTTSRIDRMARIGRAPVVMMRAEYVDGEEVRAYQESHVSANMRVERTREIGEWKMPKVNTGRSIKIKEGVKVDYLFGTLSECAQVVIDNVGQDVEFPYGEDFTAPLVESIYLEDGETVNGRVFLPVARKVARELKEAAAELGWKLTASHDSGETKNAEGEKVPAPITPSVWAIATRRLTAVEIEELEKEKAKAKAK